MIYKLTRSYRTSVKAHLKLTPELDEIIIGSLLGDLSCERRNKNYNTRLQFKQSTINELYVNHIYSLFKSYCGSKPITLSRFDDKVIGLDPQYLLNNEYIWLT